MDMFKIGILNGMGNGFLFLGTFIIGHLLDTIGTKMTAALVSVMTAIYCLLISQISTYAICLAAQSLRIFAAFPQVVESFIGVVTAGGGQKGHTEDEQARTRAIIGLGVPMGLALVLGPFIGASSISWFGADLHMSHMIVGVLLIVLLLPLILFLLPEPRAGEISSTSKMPSIWAYVDLFRDPVLKWALLLRLFVDAPYQAYDQMIRQHMVLYMTADYKDMSALLILLGLATIVTHLFLIKRLQKYLSPKRLLQVSLLILAVSYVILSNIYDFYYLLLAMPMQIVAASLALGELSAQVIGSASRRDVGKAVGFSQGIQLACAAITPTIAGYFINEYKFAYICYMCSGISVVGLVATEFVGNSLSSSSRLTLPGYFG